MPTGREIAQDLTRGAGAMPGEGVPLPLPDPLGFLEAEGKGMKSPFLVVDPLAAMCTRWLQGTIAARSRAVEAYAGAIQGQPLSPETRARAIENYRLALTRRFG